MKTCVPYKHVRSRHENPKHIIYNSNAISSLVALNIAGIFPVDEGTHSVTASPLVKEDNITHTDIPVKPILLIGVNDAYSACQYVSVRVSSRRT
jgi:hypothetical protein